MFKYEDKVELPATELTLRDAEQIEEMLTTIGSARRAERDSNIIYFSFERDSEWGACETAWEIAGELSSRGVQYTPDVAYLLKIEG